MPIPIIRQKFNLSEALEEPTLFSPEVTLPRTSNLGGDGTDPSWNTGLRNFELGLHNAQADTISSMIADKIPKPEEAFTLSQFLTFMNSQYSFILALVSKLMKAFKINTK